MDYVVPITIAVVFVATLASAYVRRRARDRCLKDFEGYHVSVELADGKLLWGRLEVFSNALLLRYSQPHRDERGHDEYSYVILEEQLGTVHGLRRYGDELTDENRLRRERAIRKAYHPSFARRMVRRSRNFLNTFRDAFTNSMATALAHAKKGGAGAAVISSGEKQLNQFGETALGAAGNAYEPVLERYIGRRVVLEEQRGDAWIEHPGILREYTAKWLEVLDCRMEEEESFHLADPERLRLNRNVDFHLERIDGAGDTPGFRVRVVNHGDVPVRVVRAVAHEYERSFGVDVEAGGEASVDVVGLPPEIFERFDPAELPIALDLLADERSADDEPVELPPLPDVQLVLSFARAVDLVLPRKRAVIRHGGEPV